MRNQGRSKFTAYIHVPQLCIGIVLRYRNHITVGVDRFLALVRSVYVVWLYDNPVLMPDENSHFAPIENHQFHPNKKSRCHNS